MEMMHTMMNILIVEPNIAYRYTGAENEISNWTLQVS